MKSKTPSALAKAVAAKRNRDGLSFREAARTIGISRTTLARAEAGEIPTWEPLLTILKWLRIDLDAYLASTLKNSNKKTR